MALPPTAVDVTRVYTKQSLLVRYLPSGAIAASGVTTPSTGIVLVSDVVDLIRRWSRKFDNAAAARGFEVPFPDISATNPTTPEVCVSWVTDSVVSEIRAIGAFGNRKPGPVTQYATKAMNDLKELLAIPSTIGYGRVSCDDGHAPELLNKVPSVDGYGKLYANYYQLANRNIIADSIRFVKADGSMVRRPEGAPFSLAFGDFSVPYASEGIIFIANEAAILSAVGVGGGVVYDFSFHKLDWGQAHETVFPSQRSS